MTKAKWVVEFEVDATWLVDGFDLDDERALDMLMAELPYACESEVRAKVIKSPSMKQLKKIRDEVVNETTA